MTRQHLAPEYAVVAGALPDLALGPESLDAVRQLMSALVPPAAIEGITQTDHVVDEASGVVVRVHRPETPADSPRPCVYSIHGGGYVVGSISMDDASLGLWAGALDCIGVSVEYRLAPEHPYPTPLEDCYAGLRWVHEHAVDLGIDRTRIGIAGASAGGGLAAALAILARDRGECPVAFQLLDCPMLDDRRTTPSSQIDDLVIWSRESNTFGWRSYLGELFGRDDVPATAAPARAEDLTGLPPAFVSVGSVDGFRDEDILYALRLNQAGVPCELHVYPGAPHGYALVPDSPAAHQGRADATRWLARQLAAPGS